MPHDKNGQELQPGDIVMIPARVKSITPNPEFCNVTVETVEPMFPGEYPVNITLNAKQVTKT